MSSGRGNYANLAPRGLGNYGPGYMTGPGEMNGYNGYYYHASQPNNTKQSDEHKGCCSLFFLRYTIFIFNSIFWLTGAGVLAICVWIMLDKLQLLSLFTYPYVYPVLLIGMFAAGVLIIFTGILGYCGALKDSKCSLCMYIMLLSVVFILEAGVGSVAYFYYTQRPADLTVGMGPRIVDNYMEDVRKTKAVDRMHLQYHCCGWEGPDDWEASRIIRDAPMENVPTSCCITPSPQCGGLKTIANIYMRGCKDQLERLVLADTFIMGAVGLGLCGLQVLGMIFGCCLLSKLTAYRYKHP